MEGRGTMKRLLIAVAVMILMSGSLAYAGPFGPIEPAAKEGKFAVGLGYFFSADKLEPSDDSYQGAADFWQKTTFSQHQLYLQAGYGLAKGWEIYGRVGAATLKGNETFDFTGYSDDFKDGAQAFGTIGLKGIFYSSPSFSIGPFVQASYFGDYKDSADGAIGATAVSMEYKAKDIWDVTFGVALQKKFDKLIFFIGPFAYYRQLKADLQITAGGSVTSDSTKFKSEYNVGGFAGVRIPVSDKVSFDIEGQFTNRLSGGASLHYSF
jgi:hypothetical protein